MGIGPVPATERRCGTPGSTIGDIGLFELNEAFAVQVLSLPGPLRHRGRGPPGQPYGGAIAVGPPAGLLRVRLMNQLARQFEEDPTVRYGLTAMCIGLGMGAAVIWENPHYPDYGTAAGAEAADTNKPRSDRDRTGITHERPDSRKRSSPERDGPHSYVRTSLRRWRKSPGTLALVTLDNGLDHQAHHARAEHPRGTGDRPGGAEGAGRPRRDPCRRRHRQAVLLGGRRGPVHGEVGQRTRAGPVDRPRGHDVYATSWTHGGAELRLHQRPALGGGLEIAWRPTTGRCPRAPALWPCRKLPRADPRLGGLLPCCRA